MALQRLLALAFLIARGAGQDAAVSCSGDTACVVAQPRPKETRGAMLMQLPLSETKKVLNSELQADDAVSHAGHDAGQAASGESHKTWGLNHEGEDGKWVYVGSCWTSQYGVLMLVVFILLLALVIDDVRHAKQCKVAEARVAALHAKLASDKAVIKADERELKTLVSQLRNDEKRLYDDIVGRGLVSLDTTGRSLRLKKNIDFVVMSHDAAPAAIFANEFEARLTLVDVAQLLRIFDSAVVLVEGHTSTPLDGIDDWAYQLAYNRAELVKLELLAFGVEDVRLLALGLPGKIGMDSHGVQLNIVGI